MESINNAKINHMISFSDHKNAIYIDKVSSKNKIGKYLWHFNNSILDKLISSFANKLLFQLKNLKNNHSSTNNSMKYKKSSIIKPHYALF